MPIGILDLYEEIKGMRRDMSQVVTSVALLTDAHEDSKERDLDFELRLRSLEKFKYTLMGAVIIINAALFAVQWIIFK